MNFSNFHDIQQNQLNWIAYLPFIHHTYFISIGRNSFLFLQKNSFLLMNSSCSLDLSRPTRNRYFFLSLLYGRLTAYMSSVALLCLNMRLHFYKTQNINTRTHRCETQRLLSIRVAVMCNALAYIIYEMMRRKWRRHTTTQKCELRCFFLLSIALN